MLGFLCAPEGGMPAAPGDADAATGAGLKAGIQSESARLEDVKDLLGEPWWRLATSNSNCTALAIFQCHERVLLHAGIVRVCQTLKMSRIWQSHGGALQPPTAQHWLSFSVMGGSECVQV